MQRVDTKYGPRPDEALRREGRPLEHMTPRRILAVQGAYYVATGAWALAHHRSFEAVSGRKNDYWLVRTVGALAVAIGGALAVASRAPEPHCEAIALSAGSAVAFGGVDAVYATAGRISRVYLVDLAAEVGFLWYLIHGRRATRPPALQHLAPGH